MKKLSLTNLMLKLGDCNSAAPTIIALGGIAAIGFGTLILLSKYGDHPTDDNKEAETEAEVETDHAGYEEWDTEKQEWVHVDHSSDSNNGETDAHEECSSKDDKYDAQAWRKFAVQLIIGGTTAMAFSLNLRRISSNIGYNKYVSKRKELADLNDRLEQALSSISHIASRTYSCPKLYNQAAGMKYAQYIVEAAIDKEWR